MTRIFIASIILAIVSAPSSAAFAQGSDEERAQEAFDRGAAFYVEGNYGRALVEFKKANRALPNPMFVVNMALANGKLGNYADALEDVESARAMGGLTPRAVALVDGASMAWSANIHAAAVAESRVVVEPEVAAKDPVLVEAAPSNRHAVVNTLGAVSLSLAVAGGIATGVHYFTVYQPARQALDDSAGESPQTIAERLGEAQTQQTVGQVLLFSSIGFAVLGTFLWCHPRSVSGACLEDPLEPSARVTPLLGPDLAGARVDFTF